MLRFVVAILLLIGMALAAPAAFGQGTGSAPLPAPGTAVEYLDVRGALQRGKFVEMLPNGAVRVRIEDGSTRLMPANRVRVVEENAAAPPLTVVPNAPATAEPATTPEPAQAPMPAAEVRTWTDSTGMFKIEAEFIALADNQVELKRTDGKVLKLQLDKLAAEDQAIAKSLAAAMTTAKPATSPAANPFEADVRDSPAVATTKSTPSQPMAPAKPPADRVATTSPSAATSFLSATPPEREAVVDLHSAPAVSLVASDKWGVVPGQVATTQPKLANSFQPISSRAANQQENLKESCSGFVIDESRNWMWVGVKIEVPAGTQSCRLERLDLASGKLLAPVRMPMMSRPMAVSPESRTLVTVRSNDHLHRGSEQVDLWQINETGLKHLQSFRPYSTAIDQFNSQVQWCRFVDESHLLTGAVNKSIVILWDLRTLKPVYRVDLSTGYYALSPDRKHLGVTTHEGIFVLDALTGKVLGQLATPLAQIKFLVTRGIAFSDDASQLAVVESSRIWVWSLADGKVIKNLPHEAALPSTGLSFASNPRYLYAGGTVLDLETNLNICGYSFESLTEQTFYGGRAILLFDYPAPNLVRHRLVNTLVIPSPEVIEKSTWTIENKLRVVPHRAKIALAAVLPFSAAEQTRVRESIASLCTSYGWELVAEGKPAEFLLECVVTPGKPKTVEVKALGVPTTTIDVPTNEGSIQLKHVASKEIVWQDSTFWAPYNSISLRVGQKLEDQFRNQPSIDFFANPKIPKYIIRGGKIASAIGASVSADEGVVLRGNLYVP
ncbi:SHD1 domain-containing protein [Anatilimnocola sp. NA78]|uniref:SHD1 domain-containing protein n=1 Tax=Anatilimnocola sp. NA78 TaxID=3415683 RepID=UPI003CE4A785